MAEFETGNRRKGDSPQKAAMREMMSNYLNHIAIIQFLLYYSDIEIHVLGFTISLVIFECIDALSEGHLKI